MKSEFSAGGVVYKKEHGKLFILLAQHSQHHGWGFPKGLIGDIHADESKEATALREVKEETGAEGKILHALQPQTYWYIWQGEKVKKTVYFYVMEYLGGDITQHDYEMETVEWLDSQDVEKRLTYNADKAVWKEAREYLEKENK